MVGKGTEKKGGRAKRVKRNEDEDEDEDEDRFCKIPTLRTLICC